VAHVPRRIHSGFRRTKPPAQRSRPPVVANNTGAQPTYRIGDLGNPNLKPWVVERMKKDNAEVLAGKIAFTPRSSCMPAGVPAFILFGFQPLFFVQTPKEVLMIYSGDQQIRRVYLDIPIRHNLSRPGMANRSVITKATHWWSTPSD
jgi:hypothetical protein